MTASCPTSATCPAVQDLRLAPHPSTWAELARLADPDAPILGRPRGAWHEQVRAELGLATDRSIVATGHQALLWHPGILAKYLAVESVRGAALATAQLVVDQHADDFGHFDVPVLDEDGALAVRSVTLMRERPGVPMALHAAFTPPPRPDDLHPALPEVDRGVDRILEAVAQHAGAPDAARQMSRALGELMRPWVEPMPAFTASALLRTGLGRALLERMAAQPDDCRRAYGAAVARVPESGIPPLAPGELPLWTADGEGRRCRADDGALAAWLDDPSRPLFPRALLLTALLRLGPCDLFVHGTGGARYDRAMEHWIGAWLGAAPAPIALVTATLRLDLPVDEDPQGVVAAARALQHRARHDPAFLAAPDAAPSLEKRAMLDAIDDAPYRSAERRRRFFTMHEALEHARVERADEMAAVDRAVRAAERRAAAAPIADRRDWAFGLYGESAIDALVDAISGCAER